MTRKFLTVLAVVALGFVVGSTAEAGGTNGGTANGGSKKYGVINVTNDIAGSVVSPYAIWLPTGYNPTTWTPAKWASMGARVVNPGVATTFPKVTPGTGNVWAADAAGTSASSAAYNVKGAYTYNYSIGGTDDVPVIKQK